MNDATEANTLPVPEEQQPDPQMLTQPAPYVSPAIKGFDLVPTTFEQAQEFANFLATSNLVPKSFRGNAPDIFVCMQWGLDLGLRPLQALQNIAVINGRPSMWGDAVLALVQASGLLEAFDEWEDPETNTSYCQAKRRGIEAPIRRYFSWSDAQRAGLANKEGPWQNYPRRMMQMRARGFCLRDGFADVLRGLQIREEFIGVTVEGEISPDGATVPASGAAAVMAKLGAPEKAGAREKGTQAPEDPEDAPITAGEPESWKEPAPAEPESPPEAAQAPAGAAEPAGAPYSYEDVVNAYTEAKTGDQLAEAMDMRSGLKLRAGTKKSQHLADLEADATRRVQSDG